MRKAARGPRGVQLIILMAFCLFCAPVAAAPADDSAARREFAAAMVDLEQNRADQALDHLDRVERLLGGTNLRVVVARIQALGAAGRYRELIEAVAVYRALEPPTELAIHVEIEKLYEQAVAAEKDVAKELSALDRRFASLTSADAPRITSRDLAALKTARRAYQSLGRRHRHLEAGARAARRSRELSGEICGMEFRFAAGAANNALGSWDENDRSYRDRERSLLDVAERCPNQRNDARRLAEKLSRRLHDVQQLRTVRPLARKAQRRYDRLRTHGRALASVKSALTAMRTYALRLRHAGLSEQAVAGPLEGVGVDEIERRIEEVEALEVELQAMRRDRNRRELLERAESDSSKASSARSKGILAVIGGVALTGGGIALAFVPELDTSVKIGIGGAMFAPTFMLWRYGFGQIDRAGRFDREAERSRDRAGRLGLVPTGDGGILVRLGGSF